MLEVLTNVEALRSLTAIQRGGGQQGCALVWSGVVNVRWRNVQSMSGAGARSMFNHQGI